MDAEDYQKLKMKFLKAFINLPEQIKQNNVLAVIEGKPYNWNSAAIEIKNDTKEGKKIINALKEIGVI